MAADEYALGVLLASIVYGGVIAAAALLVGRRYAAAARSERWVAGGVVATALLIAVHLVPAIFGVMNRWTVALAAALVFVGALAARTRHGVDESSTDDVPERQAEESRASWVLAIAAVAVVVVYYFAYLRAQRLVAPSGVDMLSFHMPDVARWIQRGSIWQAPELVPDWAQGNYPHNGEMVLLSAVLPWRDDAFVRFVYLPYLALLALAVYALSRRLSVPRPLAVIAGSLALAPPVVARTTLLSTKPDIVLWATFAAGVLFLVRHWSTRSRSDLMVAGLGLGLAFGSKWNGVAAVVAVLVVWTAALVRARRPLRQLVSLSAWVLLAGGFWLIRNAVLSGNPLFANKIAPFGVTLFDAPRDLIRERLGFSIAHYIGQPGIIRDSILPPLWRAGRLPAVIALAGVLAAAVILLLQRRRSARPSGLVVAGIAGTVALLAAYAATPLSAYGPRDAPDPLLTFVSARYGMTALIAALPVAAWAAAQLRGRARTVVELAALVAVVAGLRASVDVATKDIVVTAALCAVAAGVAWFAMKRPGRLVPAAAAALALVVLAGFVQQRQFSHHRYKGERVLALVENYAPAGYRIGIAGTPALSETVPVYPAFGPRLRNDVQWIGPLVDGVLRNWPTPAGFRGAVRRSQFDLIVIQRGSPPRPSVKEQRWLRGLGYTAVARSKALTLYKRAS